MLKAKKNSMYIDVTGVDDMTDRSTLMEEIIRRNCDEESRNHRACNQTDELYRFIKARAVEKSAALSFYLDAKNSAAFMKGGMLICLT